MYRNEFDNQTFMHPLALVVIIILGFATLSVQRRYALVPMLILLYFVSPSQRITIGGLDFNCIRLLIVAGWIRVLLKKENAHFRWIGLDWLFCLWALSSIFFFGVRYGVPGFVNRLGLQGFEQCGMYFLVRYWLRDWSDLAALARAMAILALPSLAFFLLEWSTGRNIFSIFGGVPARTGIREGRLRCQGPFPHAIIAGCAWATWMPMIAALWWRENQNRFWTLLGFLASGIIVVLTASSTPVFAAAAAVGGLAAFPLRHRMRLLRWSTLFTLIALHMVMKAPVWHLIARVSAAGGSTGYHRYKLIDNFINRADEWWLTGGTTVHWGFGQQDVTNYYVAQGVSGGILTFVLFVSLIAYSFKYCGTLRRSFEGDRTNLVLAWSLGACIFSHAMAFIGVTYFGQGNVLWVMHFAFAGALYQAQVMDNRQEVRG